MNDPTLPTTTTSLGSANDTGASTGDQAGSVTPAAPARRGRKSVAGGDQAADDATLPQTIPASEADPEPAPPCAGSWLREADGSLRPRDEGTARAAGLAWPS